MAAGKLARTKIIATPGTESNVKEIYDKCWQLREERGDGIVVFNQFEEFGNAIWHYQMTGSVIDEIFQQSLLRWATALRLCQCDRVCRHYRRWRFPAHATSGYSCRGYRSALQCPTLLQFGFGEHRIEGIGDKHVPWIHNVRNTDFVAAVDDEQTMQLMRLFNEDLRGRAIACAAKASLTARYARRAAARL